ncbi:MAG: hypothetical protein JWN93_411 [Hyphomicrobiales bacterium]|nr:hypothetical protein [Hyphomicrobiales bacterium]
METFVTQSRLGDDNARREIEALRKLSQKERLSVLIGGMVERGCAPDADASASFTRRLNDVRDGAATRASRRKSSED